MAKFTQNESLRQYLIDTGDKHLHEATVDSKWAIGADLSSKNTANGTWTGQDVLGTLLENVRNAIINGNQSMQPSSTTVEIDQDSEIDLRPMPADTDENGPPNDNINTAGQPPAPSTRSPTSRTTGSEAGGGAMIDPQSQESQALNPDPSPGNIATRASPLSNNNQSPFPRNQAQSSSRGRTPVT